MVTKNGFWELTILDAAVPANELDCLGVGDVDGDGKKEIIYGGNSPECALAWYRPDTREKGVIYKSGFFHVGMAFEDIDGDGIDEVVVGEEASPGTNTWKLTWFKPQKDLRLEWKKYTIDPAFEGGAHDILFADIDGDGENEMVTIACYTATNGLYILKRNSDPTLPWKKYAVWEGIFSEGVSIGDVNGDGLLEIVCGPDLYTQPAGGPYSGYWNREVYAPTFREMCRTAMVDITGNGRPDIVITESEFIDGYLSWFENRVLEDPEHPWVEHRLDTDLVYSHTLEARKDDATGKIRVFVAEMEQGGWNPPYNYSARLMEYSTSDHGKTWDIDILHRDDGVCGAVVDDIDNDGEYEIIGKSLGRYWHNPKVQIWDKKDKPPIPAQFKHKLIDRDKPTTGVDIFADDIDGDGLADIICANLWYKNPGWKRYEIPGVVQIINIYDIDGDGRNEYIAIDAPEKLKPRFYENFSSNLCWLKPVDPVNGKWEKHYIGKGCGDWPHGTAVAPLLPGGGLALIAAYHSCNAGKADYPDLFVIPEDPAQGPWERRTLAEIVYGEEFAIVDLNDDGLPDIVAGQYWLENLGNGQFKTHQYAEGITVGRVKVMDVNNDGKPDIVVAQEAADWEKGKIGWSGLLWFENPDGPKTAPWKMHTIDTLRCVHSLDVADIDGDGENEIICGEHDPFWPCRSRCRALIFKKADPKGRSWHKYDLDGRFEHHVGTKVFEVSPGKKIILSHGWADSVYLHLWELEK